VTQYDFNSRGQFGLVNIRVTAHRDEYYVQVKLKIKVEVFFALFEQSTEPYEQSH
jgi:hypothetical protein